MTQAIDVVNEYRALTGKEVAFDRSEFSAKRYIKWCEKFDVNPLRFMKARVILAQTGEREVPSIHQLPSIGLVNDDAWLDILDQFEGAEQDASFVDAELKKHGERYIATLCAATPAQEKFKLNTENPEVCENQQAFSGGYHPKSLHCTVCPRAGSCAERLNREMGFDVVMLRIQRGHIGYVKVE